MSFWIKARKQVSIPRWIKTYIKRNPEKFDLKFFRERKELVFEHKKIPMKPGIYVLYFRKKDGEELCKYVGATQNLRSRLRQHFRHPKKYLWRFPDFAKFKFTSTTEEAFKLEAKLIKKISGLSNKIINYKKSDFKEHRYQEKPSIQGFRGRRS